MRGRTGRRSRGKPAPPIGDTLDLEITAIGMSGDGIALHDGKPVYVPLTLPGDRLSARLTEKRGEGFAAVQVASTEAMPRREHACRHFGACGGCRLQHLPAPFYRDWKQDQIRLALKARGIEGITIRPLIDAKPETRRRLRLAFANAGDRIALGHRRRDSRQIVPIQTCPIAHPAITSLFQPLRQTLAALDLAKLGGEITITAADNGLDLLIDSQATPTLNDREGLAALAEQEDLARIAWRPDAHSLAEPITARRDVIIHFGTVPITLPPGAFLQATAPAEQAIVNAVTEAIAAPATHDASTENQPSAGPAPRVADLFAGCGAISLAAGGGGKTSAWRIKAYERDPAMVETLNAAATRGALTGRIQAKSRDLDQEPLAAGELQAFDALILDPPRAGARPQVEAIAAAKSTPAIAMASCNPRTFARDARILIDANYHLNWIQPIDAFLHSAEIELVAAFHHAKSP